ncbi:TetR/AcrR family transcriptional regulator [Limibacter armeniacum]|uniref:TetR/AcrR family transcriptional regulator n=1 Tax=Limibacter armeniacum TaxID=466084 RepID=UPI002FE56C97
MARKKEYIESEVIEKAMNLFWRNGFETTSMQLLEKEMGINKFSIYASFGNKNGVFIESIKCYRQKLTPLLDKLVASAEGVEALKQYFYGFISFSREKDGAGKGCLITNAANEIGKDADPKIKAELYKFTDEIRGIFRGKLAQSSTSSQQQLDVQADYLLISMFGLASASRTFNQVQLTNYIEQVFTNL